MSQQQPFVPSPQQVLPYAGPATGAAPQFLQPYAWREDAMLVVPAMASLPPRCVKCNAEVAGEKGSRRITLKLTWHHPALYVLILPGLLVYAIVALCVQQKATVQISLCPTHAAKRSKWLLFAWTSAVIGIGGMIFACAGGSALAHHSDMWPLWVMLGGILLAIVGGIVGIVGSRALTPKRMERGYAWLNGAHPDFVALFPDARQA
jgi:hypothetical protein